MRPSQVRDSVPGRDWGENPRPHTTRCKHGWGDCDRCGTRDAGSVVHRARSPNKREARRLRRRAAR